ncbi:MAG: helix-turn-helix domain-containing protein [Bacteroides fragilis]
MCTTVPTFDAMPQIMANILEKLETLEQKFYALQSNNKVEEDAWFSLQDLCKYLPNHPAEQTVYGWTSNHTIPFHKNGKSIIFRKSEIDAWLMQNSSKSVNDIYDEAREYVANNPKRGRK